jgi:hypothetical protein
MDRPVASLTDEPKQPEAKDEQHNKKEEVVFWVPNSPTVDDSVPGEWDFE